MLDYEPNASAEIDGIGGGEDFKCVCVRTVGTYGEACGDVWRQAEADGVPQFTPRRNIPIHVPHSLVPLAPTSAGFGDSIRRLQI
jgi:hypothetical protein